MFAFADCRLPSAYPTVRGASVMYAFLRAQAHDRSRSPYRKSGLSMNRTEHPVIHRRRIRRRNYVVDPLVQLKYAATITLVVFLVSALLSTFLYAILHQQAQLRTANPETYRIEVSLVVMVSALTFAVLTAGGVALWGIVMTHRFCGPLSVMRQQLAELGQGRFPQARPLRRNDELKELNSVLSNTVSSLRTRKRAELAALTQAVKLTRASAAGDAETMESALHSLASLLNSWRRDAAGALGVELEPLPLEQTERQTPTATAEARSDSAAASIVSS